MARQPIQSWLIAVVQNLRVLLRHQVSGPKAAAAALSAVAEAGLFSTMSGQIAAFGGLVRGMELTWAKN